MLTPGECCLICNHASHHGECRDGGYNGRPCGCTFDEERVRRGEADAAAGRCDRASIAFAKIRDRLRDKP